MSRFPLALASMLAGMLAASPVQAAARPHFIDARLVAETMSPKAGETVMVALQMVPKSGWHGYWSNPGDSGLAPVVKWTAPEGVRFGPLRHPAPKLMRVMGITSYVHAGPHLLISEMSVPSNVSPGTSLPITAKANWAACSDRLCVPERATLSLRMTVGDGSPSPDAPLLRRAAASQPRAARHGKFDVRGGKLILEAPPGIKLDARRARFFPDDNGFFNAVAARTEPTLPLRIESPATGPLPARISGVLSDGSTAYRLRFERAQLTAEEEPASDISAPARQPGATVPAAAPNNDEVPQSGSSASEPQQATNLKSNVALAALALVAAMIAASLLFLSRRKSRGG